jgi:hypothetical protein
MIPVSLKVMSVVVAPPPRTGLIVRIGVCSPTTI